MRTLIVTAALAGAAALPAGAQAADRCRAIADPQARLACYDARYGAPAAMGLATPAAPAVPAASRPAERPVRTREPRQQRAVAAPLASDGRIAAVRPMVHGYWRIELADGQVFETTQLGPPPTAGEAVHLRRTIMGTTFMDIHGRASLTVRRGRPAG